MPFQGHHKLHAQSNYPGSNLQRKPKSQRAALEEPLHPPQLLNTAGADGQDCQNYKFLLSTAAAHLLRLAGKTPSPWAAGDHLCGPCSAVFGTGKSKQQHPLRLLARVEKLHSQAPVN